MEVPIDELAAVGMPFPLFKAPLRNVRSLQRDVACSICGATEAYAFPFADHDCVVRPCISCAQPIGLRRGWAERPSEPTICPACGVANPWPADLPDTFPASVCYACLRSGRVAIAHETEAFDVEYPLALHGLARLRNEEFARNRGLVTTILETYDDGSVSTGVELPQSLLFELLRTPAHHALQREYWPYHCDGLMAYVGRWEPNDFDQHAEGGYGREWFAKNLTPDRADEWEDMWEWLEGGIAWSCVYQCQRCGIHRVYVDAD
jgi:uncharacterized protein CbrC (UPF0167 family)